MNCVETAEVGAVAGGAVVMTIPTVSNVRDTEAGDVVTVPASNQVLQEDKTYAFIGNNRAVIEKCKMHILPCLEHI